jgi:hypothetical protein
MSGHGKRELASRANAIAWRDRVIDDVRGQQGGAAASAYEVSADLVIAAAEIIAAYMAAGESEISRTDLKRSGRRSGYAIGTRQEQLLCGPGRSGIISTSRGVGRTHHRS